MKKNDASRKALRIIGSILVAIALWIYVDTVTSPEGTLKVKNVPVEFSGEDTTLADRGLMLLSGYDTTVDLVIKGPRNELRKLDRSKIRIVANTSNIKEAGSQTLTYEVVFPDNIRRGKLTVDSASIYSITVTVGELDSKEVPIQCEIVGSVADGYMAGELTLDPEVLLLDEPCSALDVKATAVIEQMLCTMKRSYAMVMVTHNIAQARRIADHVAVLYEGRLVEFGPAEDIFAHPKEQLTREFLGGIYG